MKSKQLGKKSQKIGQLSTFRPFIYTVNQKEGETPYQVFLRHTDEKEISSRALHSILRGIIARHKKRSSILDIGSGDGGFVLNALRKLSPNLQLKLFLLEPNSVLRLKLKQNLRPLPEGFLVKIVDSNYEDFAGYDSFFDVIIASRLYHIARKDRYDQFFKMVGQLKVGGHIIFILRSKDDIYYFKKKFQTEIFGHNYVTGHIKECLDTFKRISCTIPLKIKNYNIHSRLSIPIKNNFKDSISIIEFSLNTKWKEIPRATKERVLGYVKKKHGFFTQSDGISVIKRLV